MNNIFFKLSCIVSYIIIFAACKSSPQKPTDDQTFWDSVKQERLLTQEDTTDIQKKVWYKNSFIYTLDVKVFKDSDGDGIGDINGLTSKLDYIKSLGTDIIWLAPFEPSPLKDDGYDMTDNYSIDPKLGTMQDFLNLVQEVKKRNMHLIIDLVFNHTSNEHPWFLKAAQGIEPWHSWYVWSKEKPKNEKEGLVFEGVQKDIWTYLPQAKAYYYHRFYDFMPDLNTQNPQVENELKNIMNFWLKTGIDGFRVDAVTYITEKADPTTKNAEFEHDYDLLKRMRKTVTAVSPNNILLGEASVSAKAHDDFFGKHGESLNMIFGFYVDQWLFYALAIEDAAPLQKMLEDDKSIPFQNAWVYFLRNQDEMGMGKLDKAEKQKVFNEFSPAKSMQLYNRGIRRRLAPMFHNELQRMKMAYSLMFSFQGIPMIRYGDEIGMGDDMNLPERFSVRTPMQWNDSVNAGFSAAAKTFRKVIDTGAFSYHLVNVNKEEADTASLLNWIKKLVAIRKKYPAVAYGDWKIIYSGSPQVLAIRYDWNGHSILTLHNLSKDKQELKLKVQIPSKNLIDISGKSQSLPIDGDTYKLTFPSYGYGWYEIGQ